MRPSSLAASSTAQDPQSSQLIAASLNCHKTRQSSWHRPSSTTEASTAESVVLRARTSAVPSIEARSTDVASPNLPGEPLSIRDECIRPSGPACTAPNIVRVPWSSHTIAASPDPSGEPLPIRDKRVRPPRLAASNTAQDAQSSQLIVATLTVTRAARTRGIAHPQRQKHPTAESVVLHIRPSAMPSI